MIATVAHAVVQVAVQAAHMLALVLPASGPYPPFT